MCEQIGGGSPRHLNTFSNVFTAPMYTMLPKYQNIPHLVAVVHCTHVHHVTQIPEQTTPCCCCSLHPCTPCYPNTRTYHTLLLLFTAPMYTMLPKYQNIPHLVAVVHCTHVHHVTQIPEHTTPCCCCSLHPCTPCYPNTRTYHTLLLLFTAPMYTMLPKYQNIPHLVAVVQCTHVHHVAQIPEHTTPCCCCSLHPCTPCGPNTRTYHTLLLLFTAPMYTMWPKISERPNLVAIADCTI